MFHNPDYRIIHSIHSLTVTNIKGENTNLKIYEGHVCVIVNVAFKCGFSEATFKELNELYAKYGEEKGLRILAFPCNQFGNSEPTTSKDILDLATKYEIKFDLFEKVDVNGDHASPLWRFLKHKLKGDKGNFIKMDFTKFIINKNGVPVERHDAKVMPKDLISSLEPLW